jgi:hypothetical protein
VTQRTELSGEHQRRHPDIVLQRGQLRVAPQDPLSMDQLAMHHPGHQERERESHDELHQGESTAAAHAGSQSTAVTAVSVTTPAGVR